MTDGRKRTAIIAASIAAAGSLALHAASPAAAEPKIDDVRKKVDALYQKAEKASENYNDAAVSLKVSQVKLRALQADVAAQRTTVDKMRTDVARLVVSQYQGETLSAASQVVFSDDPSSFVDNLNAMTAYNSQRGQVISDYRVQLKRLKLREAAASDQVDALAKTEKSMAQDKARIDAESAKAKKLLSTLEAKQRKALATDDSTAAPVDVPASGRAAVAVKYAMAQVGDAYVWGATGPNAFDCSGLMMAAWGQAGVGLPHSSGAQQGAGARVSESQLKPGDLVFYYSPVHHVGMYIGNGKIVHAANPSAGVQVSPLHSMPYSGAVRPG